MILKQSAITLYSNCFRCGGSPYLSRSNHGLAAVHREIHWTRDFQKHQRRPERKSHVTHRAASHGGIPHWPSCEKPTPYDIFDLGKTDAYNKSRFYELVKVYHPDRHCHASYDSLSRAVKLERYRLIVLANSILSDPERRRKYDLWGAGWAGRSEMAGIRTTYPNGRSWRDQPGSPANNATWEDWEQWRHERDGTAPSEDKYMSNGLFAGIILACAAVGAFGQYAWAESHSRKIQIMRDKQHQEIVDLMKQNIEVEQFLTNGEARIQAFAQKKEGMFYSPPSLR